MISIAIDKVCRFTAAFFIFVRAREPGAFKPVFILRRLIRPSGGACQARLAARSINYGITCGVCFNNLSAAVLLRLFAKVAAGAFIGWI